MRSGFLCAVIAACLLAATTQASSDCVVNADKLAREGVKSTFIQCKENPCDGDSADVTDVAECEKTKHCYVVDDKCSSKMLAPKRLGSELEGLGSLISEEPKEEDGSPISERFFQTGGGGNPFGGGGNPFGGGLNFMPSCQPYPMGCDISMGNPMSVIQALTPPVDIPYCLRIPCDQMMPSLELDRNACVRRPGCYYDSELANMRQLVGQQVLAGVPVCQLAIRNRGFQEKVAQEKMSDGGSFNGLYSKCFIKRNPLKPNPGCPMVGTLQFFGYAPKRAGWKGITNEECLYIDGCPTANGCVLPAETKSIRVRSATVEKSRPITPKELYGQPMCQPFELDKSNPEALLNGYNQCLQSGCVVDDSVSSNEIFTALYQVVQASELSPIGKYQALRGVYAGEIGPHNIKQKLKEMKDKSCGGNPLAGLMGLQIPNLGNMLGGSYNDLSSLLSGNGNGNTNGFFPGLLGNNVGGSSQSGVVDPLNAFSLDLGDDNENATQGRFFATGNDDANGQSPFGNPSSGSNPFAGGNPFSGGSQPSTGGNDPFAGLPGVSIPTGSGSTGPVKPSDGKANLFGNLGIPFGGFPNSGTPPAGALNGNPFGGQGVGNPFGGQGAGNPFGGQGAGNPFGGQGAGNPFGGQGAGNPFGGSGNNPFTGQAGINNLIAGLGLTGLEFGGDRFGCPFSPLSLAGLPALKGRFDGCCDRNLCFYPRTTIQRQYSGIASYYGQWGAWSQCSASCGGGRQSRKRACITVNDEPCEKMEGVSETEERICGEGMCPFMTNWGAWSECSVTCGLGQKQRFRRCMPEGSQCESETEEVAECAAPTMCPVLGEWTAWGQCSSDCGPGVKSRQRPCLRNCDTVTASEMSESESCYTVNGKQKKQVGPCLPFPNCFQEVSTQCLKDDGTPGCCGQTYQENSKQMYRCVSTGACIFCEQGKYKQFCSQVRYGYPLFSPLML